MSERTPLIKRDEEDFIEEYEIEDWGLSPPVKYSLYALGVMLSLAVLYFFTVYLPEYFIPEAANLVEIVKVDELRVKLVPISKADSSRFSSGLSPGLSPESMARFGDFSDFEVKEITENPDGFETDGEADTEDYELDSVTAEINTHVNDSNDFGNDVFNDNDNYETKTKTKTIERLILIGDIHGHYIHLRNLLRKVKYDHKKDHILVLGDFISKGPDSIKVLDFLIKNKIDCIMGNHEYYVLQYYATFHGKKFPDITNTSSKYSVSGFNDDPEFLLAKKLEPDHIQYINNCPIMKKLGDVPIYKKKQADQVLKKGGITTKTTKKGVAVHGGLRWDLSLYDQIPIQSLEMRSLLGPFFNESTDDPHQDNAVSWSKIWNQHQKESNKGVVAYYGHDARRGLNLKSYSKGLDTGCDRGDTLSAMVIWDELEDNKVYHREEVFQVHC